MEFHFAGSYGGAIITEWDRVVRFIVVVFEDLSS